MRHLARSLLCLLLLCAVSLPAQQVALTPDSLALTVGDTSRVVATLTGASGLRLSYRGTNAAAFTTHLDGRVTARAPGCGYVRVGVVDSVWSRGQVRVCVVAAAPTPTPTPAPDPTPAPSPTSPGLLVNARWTAALGNTVQAVTDGGKANDPYWCDWRSILSVVSGSSVGFPRGNALRVNAGGGCGHVEFRDLFPLPAAGQFWAVRYFVMNGVGQTYTKMHPFTHFPVGAIELVHLAFFPRAGRNGDWVPSVALGAGTQTWSQGGAGGPLYGWSPREGSADRVLTAGTWYRYEYIIEWLDATRYRFYPRLYDMAGSLLNDHTTWRHSDGAGTFAEYYAQGGFFTRSARSSNPNNIRNFSFGMGQAGTGGEVYYYAADFAAAVVNASTAYLGAP